MSTVSFKYINLTKKTVKIRTDLSERKVQIDSYDPLIICLFNPVQLDSRSLYFKLFILKDTEDIQQNVKDFRWIFYVKEDNEKSDANINGILICTGEKITNYENVDFYVLEKNLNSFLKNHFDEWFLNGNIFNIEKFGMTIEDKIKNSIKVR